VSAPVTQAPPPPLPPAAPPRTPVWQRVANWAADRRLDLALILVLLLVTGIVHAINMGGFPQYFEDEATYVSQAWALQHQRTLSHYTYWYDHPPAGWLQIAAWAAPTFAWDRLSDGVQVGREVALLTKLVSVTLLFVLARRTGMHRAAATVAVLLFALSPISIFFQRMGLLDNMLMPWLLGSIVLAYSPRQRLVSYTGSGFCLAVACLTKITSGLFLPLVLYLIWKNAPEANRRYALGLFGAAFAFIGSLFPLLALLKGELLPEAGAWFPGDERVSLLGTQWWVFFARGGDEGTIFDAGSGASIVFWDLWLVHDKWLLGLGLLASLLAILSRRYRWIGVMYLTLAGTVLFFGFLSYPYIVTFLPLAALAIGGVLDLFLRGVTRTAPGSPRRWMAGALAAAVWAPLVLLIPAWSESTRYALSHDANGVYRDAAAWIAANADSSATILVDNVTWIDLVAAGRARDDVVWLYKLEYDPEVIELHGDWRSFDYVVSSAFARSQSFGLPQTSQALENSEPIAVFSEPGAEIERVEVRRIVPEGLSEPDEGSAAGEVEVVPAPDPALESETSEQPSEVYVVQAGDTLWQIARAFGATISAIAQDNAIADPDLILPGQELEIVTGE
jgi:4-amino-4-deoxy-L-arabinose transferase-like glycosyltransferase